MKYKGYDIWPKYVEGSKIVWESTGGNGSIIIGSQGGKDYFIKKNTNVRLPSDDCSPAMYEAYQEKAAWIENKQAALARLMSGLTFDRDHVAVEEQNFWDEEDKEFVTITRLLKDVEGGKHNFSGESNEVKRDLFIKMTELVGKLHKHGVIHGDLKEGNFLFKKSGSTYEVYVIDFDSSYPAADIPWPVRVPYTPGYESPEIVIYQGNAEDDDDTELSYLITPATDVFTLALIFHKIWTFDMPGYATEDPSYGIALASVPETKPVMNHGLDTLIGPNNGATYISLMNWMLTRMPGDRPTCDQVLAVLRDEAVVPSQYVIGKDVAPFTGLWMQHQNLAKYDEEALKAKGVVSFQKINEGGLKYLVRTADGEERYTIQELLSDGLLEEKPAEVCEPWPEDGMEFASPDVIRSKKISSIKRIQSAAGTKMYEVLDINGTKSFKNGKSLIGLGVASVKVEAPSSTAAGDTWPEDNATFASATFLASKHVEKIEKTEAGGQHLYTITYNDGKEPKILAGKTMLLLGLLVAKR